MYISHFHICNLVLNILPRIEDIARSIGPSGPSCIRIFLSIPIWASPCILIQGSPWQYPVIIEHKVRNNTKCSSQRSDALHVNFIFTVSPYCLSCLTNFTGVPHLAHTVFENRSCRTAESIPTNSMFTLHCQSRSLHREVRAPLQLPTCFPSHA